MKTREQLIKELNRYFPECEAQEQLFDPSFPNQIWFHGEDVATKSAECDCGESGSWGFIDYLIDNGWYIELHDEVTAIAVRDSSNQICGVVE